jgi:hypothetical protein
VRHVTHGYTQHTTGLGILLLLKAGNWKRGKQTLASYCTCYSYPRRAALLGREREIDPTLLRIEKKREIIAHTNTTT